MLVANFAGGELAMLRAGGVGRANCEAKAHPERRDDRAESSSEGRCRQGPGPKRLRVLGPARRSPPDKPVCTRQLLQIHNTQPWLS